MPSPIAPSLTTRRLCALVFAACAAPRIAVLLRTAEPSPNYYWEIATSLLASGTYGFGSGATTAIEPLYPLFLAAARGLTGDRFTLVMLLQIAIASAGGVLVFLLAARMTARRSAAILAAALYAFYPYYVRQSIAPHELTLSAVLLAAAAWQHQTTLGAPGARRRSSENIRHAALLGLALGLLLLLRFSFAPVCAGAVVVLLMRRRAREAATAAAVMLVVVAPWVLRARAIDSSTAPTRVGENLFIASCEFAEEVLPWYDADLMVIHAYRAVDADAISARVPPHLVERTIDDALMRRAVDCIRADPLRALRLKLRNLLYVFAPVLLPNHARLEEAAALVENGRLRLVNIYPRPWLEAASHAAAHTIVLAGALIGLAVRRRQLLEDAFLVVIVASTALVYAIFFPTTRLTAPMTVVLMVYAAVGYHWIFRVKTEATRAR